MARRTRMRGGVRPEWRFPLRFLALAAVLFGVGHLLEPFRAGLTRVVLAGTPTAASLFGLSSQPGDAGLISFADGRFAYTVTHGCTGVAGIVLLASAIGAYPSTRRYPVTLGQRLRAMLAGAVGLLLLNWVRLGALAWIGVNAPDQFDAAHIYWFQGLMIMAVGLGWLAWVRLVVQRDADVHHITRVVGGLGASARRFAVAFAALATAGVLLGADRLYGSFVAFFVWLAAPFVWGIELGSVELGTDLSAYLYGSLIGVFALIVATTPSTRHRVAIRFAGVAPLIAAAQVIALVAQTGLAATDGFGDPLGTPLPGVLERLLAVPMDLTVAAIPLALWFQWAHRPEQRHERIRGTQKTRQVRTRSRV